MNFSSIFKTKKICPNPFLALEIHNDGNVSFCCTARLKDGFKSIGNILNEPLDSIWNSTKAKTFRKLMYEHRYDQTCQSYCPQLIAARKGIIPPWYSEFCEVDTYENINQELTCLSSPYKAVSIASDNSCNLSCIMCRNELKSRPSEKESAVNRIALNTIYKDIQQINFLELTGTGDPFYQHGVINFLKRLNGRKHTNLSLRLITNGQLINAKQLKLIQDLNLKKLSISVSIDAASAFTYESIRRGGKWNVLTNNMNMLSENRQKQKIDVLQISFVVMKRNLEEMISFVRLGLKWNVDKIDFQRIFGNKAGDENIFDIQDRKSLKELAEIIKHPIFREAVIDISSIEKEMERV